MLTSTRVCSFAESQIRLFLGTIIPRTFLAGGAYKSIVNKRPPRDLDLWAETPSARTQLIERLRTTGTEIEASPGAQRFLVNRMLIEVSFQIETMDERLQRFDLGISAIAVAFRNGELHPWIHPQALSSVRDRRIYLIQCHQRLLLATLVRARRYAHDLDYSLPESLETMLWNRHLSLSLAQRKEQRDQLFLHYGEDTWGVLDEAVRRAQN